MQDTGLKYIQRVTTQQGTQLATRLAIFPKKNGKSGLASETT